MLQKTGILKPILSSPKLLALLLGGLVLIIIVVVLQTSGNTDSTRKAFGESDDEQIAQLRQQITRFNIETQPTDVFEDDRGCYTTDVIEGQNIDVCRTRIVREYDEDVYDEILARAEQQNLAPIVLLTSETRLRSTSEENQLCINIERLDGLDDSPVTTVVFATGDDNTCDEFIAPVQSTEGFFIERKF